MTHNLSTILALLCLTLSFIGRVQAQAPAVQTAARDNALSAELMHVTFGVDVGEQVTARLLDGSRAHLKLIDVHEVRDSVRSALREAHVTIEINGEKTMLVSGNYRLPTKVGGV